MKRNEPCWCGSGKKWKKCHFPDEGKVTDPEELRKQYYKKYQVILKSEAQIAGIRTACKLSSDILEKVCAKAVAGITTDELEKYAQTLHEEAGAIPAALNYGSPPYPKSICISLNEVICHGIADDRKLQEGDILNIDVASILDGYYGDCSKMVCIGKINPEKQLVVDTSYECLMEAIRAVKPGEKVCAIGEAIESHAEKKGCSVVHQFVGHGVGINFHEGPHVPHCRNSNQIEFVPGMTFTIEPMINAGVAEGIIDPSDEWTARTKDGKPSAQFEHTLLVTESGCEILTTWKR